MRVSWARWCLLETAVCPSYYYRFYCCVVGSLEWALEDLSNIVKYLLNFKFDLHFYLENVYLRELVIQPMLERMAEYRVENTVDVQKAIDSIYIHNIERSLSKDFQWFTYSALWNTQIIPELPQKLVCWWMDPAKCRALQNVVEQEYRSTPVAFPYRIPSFQN